MRLRLFLPLAALLCALPAVARADEPDERRGFTFELGIGLGYTSTQPSVGNGGISRLGLAPLSFSLGGYVSQDTAILFRAVGTSFFVDDGYDRLQLVNGFYGVVAQYWASDSVYVSAGPGLALFAANPLLSHTHAFFDPIVGMGLDARLGFALSRSSHDAFSIALETNPSFYSSFPQGYSRDQITQTNSGGAYVLGGAINLIWQHY
jgi:hypothetical protein